MPCQWIEYCSVYDTGAGEYCTLWCVEGCNVQCLVLPVNRVLYGIVIAGEYVRQKLAERSLRLLAKARKERALEREREGPMGRYLRRRSGSSDGSLGSPGLGHLDLGQGQGQGQGSEGEGEYRVASIVKERNHSGRRMLEVTWQGEPLLPNSVLPFPLVARYVSLAARQTQVQMLIPK